MGQQSNRIIGCDWPADYYNFFVMAAINTLRWTDLGITNLLQLHRSRECLWNIKSESYRDRNKIEIYKTRCPLYYYIAGY